jgi:hypothetical protein
MIPSTAIFQYTLLMSGFLVKHFLGDFLLQSKRMVADKTNYGGKGSIYHVLIHVGLTNWMLVAFSIMSIPMSIKAIGIASLAEGAIHYHIDYVKAKLVAWGNFSIQQHRFWDLFGLDQMLHGLTYVAMLYWLLS